MTVFVDPNSMTHWFPRLVEAGLPVPRTVLVDMPVEAQECVWSAFDGEDKNVADFEAFAVRIADAAATVGYPCFLRTDHTSAKHGWKDTCYIKDEADIASHVFRIAETSELMGIGLPYSTWAVRELLPTIPLAVCHGYGDMPVCREFRFFVEDGRIVCRHPYWPIEALQQGGVDADLDYEALCKLPDDGSLDALASSAGAAVGGAWSVDILETRRGWFVTDMAETHKSFHWRGCAASGG